MWLELEPLPEPNKGTKVEPESKIKNFGSAWTTGLVSVPWRQEPWDLQSLAPPSRLVCFPTGSLCWPKNCYIKLFVEHKKKLQKATKYRCYGHKVIYISRPYICSLFWHHTSFYNLKKMYKTKFNKYFLWEIQEEKTKPDFLIKEPTP